MRGIGSFSGQRSRMSDIHAGSKLAAHSCEVNAQPRFFGHGLSSLAKPPCYVLKALYVCWELEGSTEEAIDAPSPERLGTWASGDSRHVLQPCNSDTRSPRFSLGCLLGACSAGRTRGPSPLLVCFEELKPTETLLKPYFKSCGTACETYPTPGQRLLAGRTHPDANALGSAGRACGVFPLAARSVC